MMNINKIKLCGLGLLLVASQVSAELVPFSDSRWQFHKGPGAADDFATVSNYLGQETLSMSNGLATLDTAGFSSGTIEYDIAFSGAPSYVGPIWNIKEPAGQTPDNYEMMLSRGHNSGTDYALHYYPTFNGLGTFKFYYDAGRFNTAVTYDTTASAWTHFKIVIANQQAEVFVNDMTQPALFIDELKQTPLAGGLGIMTSFGMHGIEKAHISNFSYEASDTPPAFIGTAKPFTAPAGIVTAWSVSNAFDAAELVGKNQVTEADRTAHTWQTLASDRAGRNNFGMINRFIPAGIPNVPAQNAAYAKIIITSDRDQIKQFQFGFSDKYQMYLNGQIVAAEDETTGSRDYRFIGTVAYNSNIYLDLRKGQNELWIAVSEFDFGGWGVHARFPNMDGISVSPEGQTDLNALTAGNVCMAGFRPINGELYIPCVAVPGVNPNDPRAVFEATLQFEGEAPNGYRFSVGDDKIHSKH
jgi:hypothetical protein